MGAWYLVSADIYFDSMETFFEASELAQNWEPLTYGNKEAADFDGGIRCLTKSRRIVIYQDQYKNLSPEVLLEMAKGSSKGVILADDGNAEVFLWRDGKAETINLIDYSKEFGILKDIVEEGGDVDEAMANEDPCEADVISDASVRLFSALAITRLEKTPE